MQTQEAYRSPRPESNPTPLFMLVPALLRRRLNLADQVGRALVTIKPWLRSWDWRLGRLWNTWRGGTTGNHAKRRGAREARLRDNLRRFAHRRGYADLATRQDFIGRAARPVHHELRRLLAHGDWWKDRRLIDTDTGETRSRPYLPEDTWLAAHLLDWCVSILERLALAAHGTTTGTTRAYKPVETATGRRGRNGPPGNGDGFEEHLARLRERYGGPQMPLPTA